MKMAKEKMFCKTCGTRPDYPHVLVGIGDGRSSASENQLKDTSNALKVDRENLKLILFYSFHF